MELACDHAETQPGKETQPSFSLGIILFTATGKWQSFNSYSALIDEETATQIWHSLLFLINKSLRLE